jgi:ribosomal protein L11 methyltransferase
MENKFYEIQIVFGKDNYDELYNALYINGIENILEEDGMLKVYFDISETEKVNALKNSLLEDKIIKKKDFLISESENQNWNEEWEKTIEPVYIKDKIIIYPSWKKDFLKDIEDKILIEIDPKMSFGTGHNETTQLVLELMSDYIKGDEEMMLDFGCGTGVLTIAGIKLGVKNAVAIDIDDDSVENAKEYFKKNSVTKNVKLKKSVISEIEEDSFDVICANIIRSVITDNFEHIKDKLKSKGKLFISGVLSSEDQEMLELLILNDFDVEDIQIKSEWIGIYAVKI